jgi:hypothetical protein
MFNFSSKFEQYHPKNDITKDTLFDKNNGNKYVIDKTRTIITAYNKKGRIIWKTNPYEDSFLPVYRYKKTYIVSFKFVKRDKKEVIFIVYHNTVFGYLLKSNGKFYKNGND